METNLVLPLITKDNKLFLNVKIGLSDKIDNLMIDTASYYSWIFDNDSFNNTEIETKYEKTEKFYYSSSNITMGGNMSKNDLILGNEMNVRIQNYGFIINDKKPSNYEDIRGVLSLSRGKKEIDENYMILGKLIGNNYIDKKIFTIIRRYFNQTPNITLPYIIFGSSNKYLNDNSHLHTYCNLYKYDPILSESWTCNMSHILISSNEDTNIQKHFKDINYKIDAYATFDSSIENILIPSNAKLIKTTQFSNETNLIGKEEIYAIEYFTNILSSKNENCILTNLNSTNYPMIFTENYLENLQFIMCKTNLNSRVEFLNSFINNFNSIHFVLNGIAYKFSLEELFSEYSVKNENDQNYKYTYHFKMFFYSPNNNSMISYWVLGNLFMKKFDSISFDSESNKILFSGGSSTNLTEFTHDINEIEPIFSFFLLSIIFVVILIIIVLLVPYILYRQKRKAQMEKLQYDVIYKKMDDISKELTK